MVCAAGRRWCADDTVDRQWINCSASEDNQASSNSSSRGAFAALSGCRPRWFGWIWRAGCTQTIRDCSSAVVLSAQKVGLQNPTERISHHYMPPKATQSPLEPPKLLQVAPVSPQSTPNQQPPKAPRRGISRHSLVPLVVLSLPSCPLRLQPFLAWPGRNAPSPSYGTAMRCDAMQEHGQGSGMTLSFANDISFFLCPNETPKWSLSSVVCLRLSCKAD